MRLALIGAGRWGSNIKKTLAELGVTVAYICDPTAPLSSRAPLGGETKVTYKQLVRMQDVDGILVASPGSTHAQIALPFIKKGLPVFIEKPMTTNLKDALRLQRAATAAASLVFVGHLHLHNPAFWKAKALVQQAGKISYASFEGMNWGPVRADMSAWWDWGPHDIAMALELFGKPVSIQAWGDYQTTVAKLTFEGSRLDSPLPVFMHVSTFSPEKRKKVIVVGEKYSVVFDDTKLTQKVAVIREKKVTYYPYDVTMPLTVELQAFLQMIKSQRAPKTDILSGVQVVRILAAAERSMRRGGKQVRL